MADVIFQNRTADGNSARFLHSAQRSGILHIYVSGDLGGATLILKAICPHTGLPMPMPGAEEITTTGLKVIQTISFVGEMELTGATGTTDVTAVVETERDAFKRVGDLE